MQIKAKWMDWMGQWLIKLFVADFHPHWMFVIYFLKKILLEIQKILSIFIYLITRWLGEASFKFHKIIIKNQMEGTELLGKT